MLVGIKSPCWINWDIKDWRPLWALGMMDTVFSLGTWLGILVQLLQGMP